MSINNLFLSIVIPARNAQGTLKQCLRAVFSSVKDNFEVIVIDDASDDATSDIAKKFQCVLIKLNKKSGPAFARNRGVEASKGNIILFIDSDIIINENTIPLILDNFSSDSELAAVVGMLNEKIPHENLPSQFFNLRKHYDYLLIDSDLSTLYTSITAIRKDIFIKVGGFNEKYTTASMEDAELGRRLYKFGYKIQLNKKISVVHLKYHTLMSLLKSDFSRASFYIKFSVRERLAGDIAKEKRFGSFRGGSLVTVVIVPAIILALIFSFYFKWTDLVLYTGLLIFLLANYRFIRFTGKIIGWRKNFIMPLIIFIDSLAVVTGIFSGLVSSIRGK